MKRTLYGVLGANTTADAEEIRVAYERRLEAFAAQGNSDPGAVGLVREAYRILSDKESRSAYDRSLFTPVIRQGTPQAAVGGRFSRWTWIALAASLASAIALGWKTTTSLQPPRAAEQRSSTPNVQQAQTGVVDSQTAGTPPAAAISRTPDSNDHEGSPEQVFAQVSPSITRVNASDAAGRGSRGSGVVISHGTVLTNCHVIAGATLINVTVGSFNSLATRLVSDEALDLCSLTVPTLDAPPAKLGRVASLRVGQRVYAIGAPRNLDLTFSEGIVSSLREGPDGTVIQTTAPISPGSSGGGLFDSSGSLVGITTFQHRYGQNLNFALPVDWIEAMRTRSRTQTEPTPRAPDAPPAQPAPATSGRASAAELIVGYWSCFAGVSGRRSDFRYARNGGLVLATSSGRAATGRYTVVGGNTVVANIEGRHYSTVIQNITPSTLVLKNADYSEWLNCERTSAVE